LNVGDLPPLAGSPTNHLLLRIPAGSPLDDDTPPAGVESDVLVPALDGGLLVHKSPRAYLNVPGALPRVVDLTQSAVVDNLAVAPIGGAVSLDALPLETGDHVVVSGHTRLRFRLVDALREGPEDLDEVAWCDGVTAPARLHVPCTGMNVWLVGEQGELVCRDAPKYPWIQDLGLLGNAVDTTGLASGVWFAPAYVITEYTGKPYVHSVPEGMVTISFDEPPRELDVAAARSLVEALLHRYGPDERMSDQRWKRVFAALFRTVHQR
jgi:hypothetical protein